MTGDISASFHMDHRNPRESKAEELQVSSPPLLPRVNTEGIEAQNQILIQDLATCLQEPGLQIPCPILQKPEIEKISIPEKVCDTFVLQGEASGSNPIQPPQFVCGA
jgi:hypothetical protein